MTKSTQTNHEWEAYIGLHWTSENDECEWNECTNIMGPDGFTSDNDGNYCSEKCKKAAADYWSSIPYYDDGYEDFGADLGIHPSDPLDYFD